MTPQQLRNSILQMAIEGKLTRQLPEDGNAADLLKKIKAEKAKLIKEKKIKKEKPLPEIGDDEIPFEIPDNWCWVRLDDVGNWKAGATPSRDNPKYYGGSIPWLKTGDLNDGYINFFSEYITNEAVDSNSLRLNPVGSVLMAMYGATIGKLGILQRAATTNQACCACVPYCEINNKYVFYFLLANRKKFIKLGSGGAQPNISRQKIIGYVIPLPPAAEQKRIVARLEEILPLVDAYEKAYNELKELNKKFPVNLKNSLLQMAIEGKLVEQRPEDGNAADLLKQIKAEKAKLIKEKKIKKEKPLPEIGDDEIPFEVPENWCWVRLGDLVLKDMGGGTPSKENPKFWNGTIPWMSVKDFSYVNNGVIDDTIDHITLEGVEGSSTNIIDPSAIVLCVRMGLGRYAKLSKPTAINQDLRAFWLSKNIDENYFLSFYSSISIEGTGTTVKGIKRNELLNLCCPLPPLGEQKRIVAKLEQLLPLCDKLMKHG